MNKLEYQKGLLEEVSKKTEKVNEQREYEITKLKKN